MMMIHPLSNKTKVQDQGYLLAESNPLQANNWASLHPLQIAELVEPALILDINKKQWLLYYQLIEQKGMSPSSFLFQKLRKNNL